MHGSVQQTARFQSVIVQYVLKLPQTPLFPQVLALLESSEPFVTSMLQRRKTSCNSFDVRVY